MLVSVEFLLGLLEHEHPAYVAREDFDGVHGKALRLWRRMGLIGKEPGWNPVAGCPFCDDGVPYPLGGRFVCSRCRSTVDGKDLLLWRVDLDAFLRWLARSWSLRGGVRAVDPALWRLGTRASGAATWECFYLRRGPLPEPARQRLAAYRNALVLYNLTRPSASDAGDAQVVSLLGLLRLDGAFTVNDWPEPRRAADVRFEARSGALWAGGELLGEVPVGSKEFAFLAFLAANQDRYVSYRALKQAVLAHSGSTDTTEEATFCQGLKSRIKKRWIPQIDRLLVTTNKGDGYRLRGQIEPCGGG